MNNELLQMLDGRRVAIVGNGVPDQDYSAEIDSADVVIRFNHFYNYDSGKVGKRVDIVMQVFTSAWDQAKEKHADVLKGQHARIFCVRKPNQYSPVKVAGFLGPDVCVSDMSEFFQKNNDWTSGGTVLTTLAGIPLNSEVRCYCFPQGKTAEDYFSGPAKHYRNWKQELVEQKRAIEILERSSIVRPRTEPETTILIPVKEYSEGAPGKNDVLLPHLLDTLRPIGLRKVLVGKADRLAERMKALYDGVEYFRTGDPVGEVTKDLRMWRDFTGFCGEVILLQCTSPGFDASWIGMLQEARRHAPVAAVCEKVGFKVNGLFGCSNGVWMQVVPMFGAPSVPRQKLPDCIHLTGGGFAFHSDALSRTSFFYAGVLRPVIVEASRSLDVDTEQDLAVARSMFNLTEDSSDEA